MMIQVRSAYNLVLCPLMLFLLYIEKDCPGFSCRDGRCLTVHDVCNGKNDCLDGSDEIETVCGGR